MQGFFGDLQTDGKDCQGVVTNMSMMTIRPEFFAHFLDIHIKKTEGAKFTGYMQLDSVGTLHSAVLMDLSSDSTLAEAAMYMRYIHCSTFEASPQQCCS